MSNRATLGLLPTAGAEEIKKAYRKLAMAHHPDRNINDPTATARFQQINSAFKALEDSGFAPEYVSRPGPRPGPRPSWNKPEDPSGTWRDDTARDENIDDILDQMKRANRGRGPRYPGADPMSRGLDGEIVANVSMRDAFAGFNVQVSRRGTNGMINHLYVNIPAGTPNGYRGKYRLSDGSYETIITKIETGNFHLRGFGDADDLFSAGLTAGDVEIEVELDAIDLITGTWTKVTDFLGEELTVRVPAGFNPLQRLKVANKGYAGWDESSVGPAKWRQHMYVRIRPIFNKLTDLSPAKLKALHETIEGLRNESE